MNFEVTGAQSDFLGDELEGLGESNEEGSAGFTIELGLNGQFLIMKSWAETGEITDEQREFGFAHYAGVMTGQRQAYVHRHIHCNRLRRTQLCPRGAVRRIVGLDKAAYVMVVTPAQGVSFQRRTPAGASSSSNNEAGITAPQWVKIERTALKGDPNEWQNETI